MSKVLPPPAFVPARLRAPAAPAEAASSGARDAVRQPAAPTPRTPRPAARPGKAAPALWQNLRPVPAAPAKKAPPDPAEVARGEAQSIVAEAREQVEHLRRRTEARAAADGQQRARAQARTDLRRLTRQARSILKEARALRQQAIAQLGDEVVETAVALAKAVVVRRAEQTGDDLRELARQLIAEARRPQRARAHPADGPALDGLGVPVEADPGMARGGLVLFAADGERDARLERRISELDAVLREVDAHGA